jgi:hypothetical protein
VPIHKDASWFAPEGRFETINWIFFLNDQVLSNYKLPGVPVETKQSCKSTGRLRMITVHQLYP